MTTEQWCCDYCGRWNAVGNTCSCGCTEQSWEPISPQRRLGTSTWNMNELDKLVEGSRLQRYVANSELLVIWHGGATFNVYDALTLTEVDVFTVYGDDKGNPIQNIDKAANAIDRWYSNQDD